MWTTENARVTDGDAAGSWTRKLIEVAVCGLGASTTGVPLVCVQTNVQDRPRGSVQAAEDSHEHPRRQSLLNAWSTVSVSSWTPS